MGEYNSPALATILTNMKKCKLIFMALIAVFSIPVAVITAVEKTAEAVKVCKKPAPSA